MSAAAAAAALYSRCKLVMSAAAVVAMILPCCRQQRGARSWRVKPVQWKGSMPVPMQAPGRPTLKAGPA